MKDSRRNRARIAAQADKRAKYQQRDPAKLTRQDVQDAMDYDFRTVLIGHFKGDT